MEITTKEQAFYALDHHQYGVPFEAIEFLYNHPTDEDILSKIKFAFKNAPLDYYYNEELDHYSNTELWYAIVAENHLDLSLLDAMIDLLLHKSYDDEYLNEQISFLASLMTKKHGALAIDKILVATEHAIPSEEVSSSYDYLFDALFYVDESVHSEALQRIFEHVDNEQLIYLGIILCHKGFKSLLPAFKEMIQFYEAEAEIDDYSAFIIEPLKEAVEALEQGNPMEEMKPYHEMRPNWKDYYQEAASDFEEEAFSDHELNPATFLTDEYEDSGYFYDKKPKTVKNVEKIGRNQPCPCGSGKKYKQCCLKN